MYIIQVVHTIKIFVDTRESLSLSRVRCDYCRESGHGMSAYPRTQRVTNLKVQRHLGMQVLYEDKRDGFRECLGWSRNGSERSRMIPEVSGMVPGVSGMVPGIYGRYWKVLECTGRLWKGPERTGLF